MKQYNEQHRLRTCLWIVNALQNSGALTLSELNKKWLETDLSDGEEIITRTFYNYRSAIQDLFSIIISCDKRTNKYFIECHDEDDTTQWLLSSFSVSQLLQNNKDISDRILLESIPSGQKFLSTIIEAMRKNNVIELSYCRFVEEEPHIALIEPYCTKLFHQRWYVVGNNVEKKHLQTYALDRIQSIKILTEEYTVNPLFNAKKYFESSFGIYASDNKPAQRIQIKVDSLQRKYLRTLPLHATQKELVETNDYSIFEYNLVPTEDFIIELMSHGNHFEVLAPADLRKEMQQHFEAAAALYK